jgi:hypothetical protein
MILIHIGLMKAGSTSIQGFLRANQESLRGLSVDYPKIGRVGKPAHHNFAAEIAGRQFFNPATGTLSELCEYWRTAPSDTLVLSSEYFAESEVEQIAGLRQTLISARGNDDFRIVLVLRDLLDLIPSFYAQNVKFGKHTHDFDTFFRRIMRERQVDHFAMATRWADVFGWERLELRLLERKYLLNGDLLDDFIAICGIKRDGEASPHFRRPKNRNISPGWKVLEATRALFADRPDLPEERPETKNMTPKEKRDIGLYSIRAGKNCGWNDDKGDYLTASQAAQCVEVYSTGIRAINERVRDPLPEPPGLETRNFTEREFLPDIDHIPTEELRAFYADLAAIAGAPAGSRRRRRKRRSPEARRRKRARTAES